MKLWSQLFIPTLKESPAEAEIASHKLLFRAGLVRKLAGGLYSYLPLGLRVSEKIKQICREEMEAAGAIELLMPAVHPAELWKNGPRWRATRELMYSVHSAGADAKTPDEPQYVLGPTHEEVITPLVANEISSYRELPKNFFQIQMKYRNEIRPRYGLMRAREFLMKDGYSFDVSDEAANESFYKMERAYGLFFKRCGLKCVSVDADSGVMGGSFSKEFMVPAEVGDDDVVFCSKSGYAANREKATSGLVPTDLEDVIPEGEVEEFATPDVSTIADLAKEPYHVSASKQFKTLLYVGDGQLFAVVLRGEDGLEEAKLSRLGFDVVRPATVEEIEPVMGAKPGSLGVVKGRMKNRESLQGIYADKAIRLIGNGVTGANKEGFHLRNVNVTRDLDITDFGDFRRVVVGEPCPLSGESLEIERAIEVGHVFKLGTKYSEKFNAVFTDDAKGSNLIVMGSYGIGISRTLQAIIEQSHDKNGIIWPWSVAPYQVVISVLDPASEEAMRLAVRLAKASEEAGADVLIDDRDDRPGVKFKDADLVGFPLRVTIGARGLKEGIVEIKGRSDEEAEKIPLAEVEKKLGDTIKKMAAGE